jgi:Family of unknown function (DUF6527)
MGTGTIEQYLPDYSIFVAAGVLTSDTGNSSCFWSGTGTLATKLLCPCWCKDKIVLLTTITMAPHWSFPVQNNVPTLSPHKLGIQKDAVLTFGSAMTVLIGVKFL